MLLHDQAVPPARDYLKRILESGQRINDIIDDMINLRELETRQSELILEDINVHVLVRESIMAVQQLAQAKGQVITIEDDGLSVPDCMLDLPKIEIVLTSLLSNAIKFTPLGGSITLRTWSDEIRSVPYHNGSQAIVLTPGKWTFISIRDSGIGISEQQQRRIFERFYQVADSLTREQGGTGLGLALVRGLVTLHHGQVWVESQEGHGSTFTIALPQRGPQSHNS
jgi:signal transduction histidine kinase